MIRLYRSLHSGYSFAELRAVPLVLYGLLVSLLAPVAVVVGLLLRRGRVRPLERLGFWKPAPICDWWFHGASVGEVAGIIPILKALKTNTPTTRILVTTTSPTGLVGAEGIADEVRLLPFDSPWCIARAMRRIPAKNLVISETELWPTLIAEATQAGMTLYLINGRISDYTAKSYRYLQFLFAPLLSTFHRIFVVANRDRERLLSLGAPADRIEVVGNTKYDITPTITESAEKVALRERLFPDLVTGVSNPADKKHSSSTKIVVLGSVRPGEETDWFSKVALFRSKRLEIFD